MNNTESSRGELGGKILFGACVVATSLLVADGVRKYEQNGDIGDNARDSYEQEYLGPDGCLTDTPFADLSEAAYYPVSNSLRVDPGEFGGEVLRLAVGDEFQLTPLDDATRRILTDEGCDVA